MSSPTPSALRAETVLGHRLEFWKYWLRDYPDQDFVARLLHYIEFGVPIGFKGCQESIISPNWPSSSKFHKEVSKFIDANLVRGSIEGPLPHLHSAYRASPLGAFQKRNSGKVRPIHDLSWPPGRSVNDGINKYEYPLCYVTVDDAMKLCTKFETPYMAKMDLESAFLYVTVRKEDRHLLGFSWESEYYNFSALPFGLKSAPKLFDEMATALEWIMKARGASEDTIHYLDDFWTVTGEEVSTNRSLDIMIDSTNQSGFSNQVTKEMRGTRVGELLGLIIDTVKWELRISDSRMKDIKGELQGWKGKVWATKREILSLLGRLAFCSRVVRDGHTFIRRLIQLSTRARNLHHKVKITNQARADISWWISCLESHNGKTCFPRPWIQHQAEIIYTDASDIALGIFYKGSWSVLQFTGRYAYMARKSIAWRELLAVVACLATFAQELSGKDVTMFIDNLGIVQCLESGKSDKPDIMCLIRAIYYYASINHIRYKPMHIRSGDNSTADALSRLDFNKFWGINPGANTCMSSIPELVMDFN